MHGVGIGWIDVELSATDPETKRLLEVLGPEATNLPVVLFPDGTKLLESVPADVALKVGLHTRAQTDFYDLAIIGGGPAGLAAAVYGASWCFGRTAHRPDRARGPWRAGGNELANRKLSGISNWP
jgi:NADPH-dependent 2,4-dienoyl-CoA reductase/sulfur reductase-like enzyme